MAARFDDIVEPKEQQEVLLGGEQLGELVNRDAAVVVRVVRLEDVLLELAEQALRDDLDQDPSINRLQTLSLSLPEAHLRVTRRSHRCCRHSCTAPEGSSRVPGPPGNRFLKFRNIKAL